MLHLTVNRNKRAICLDVKQPEGASAFCRLVEMGRRRSSRASAAGWPSGSASTTPRSRAMNPRLIYCSISAFGPEGPWREKPGLDSLAQALGGLMAITGEPDGGPVLCGAPVADTIGGMLAIQGILTALIARAANGQGQRVDASLLNGMLFAHTARLSVFHETGEAAAALRQRASRDRALPGLPARADGWIFVAAWVDACGCPSARRSAWTRSAPIRASPRARTGSRTAASSRRSSSPGRSARARSPTGWRRSSRPTCSARRSTTTRSWCGTRRWWRPGSSPSRSIRGPARFKTVATPVKLEKTPGTIRTPAPAPGRALAATCWPRRASRRPRSTSLAAQRHHLSTFPTRRELRWRRLRCSRTRWRWSRARRAGSAARSRCSWRSTAPRWW